jgi:hypothetical protein
VPAFVPKSEAVKAYQALWAEINFGGLQRVDSGGIYEPAVMATGAKFVEPAGLTIASNTVIPSTFVDFDRH